MLSLADEYSHIVASATTTGKNFMPRVAALLDVAQISEIIDVIDADTFKRPIYAGNAIATVKSLDNKKVITVRASSFDPVAVSCTRSTTVLTTLSTTFTASTVTSTAPVPTKMITFTNTLTSTITKIPADETKIITISTDTVTSTSTSTISTTE